MMYIQAMTPVDITTMIPGISLEEARKIVSAVHRNHGLPETIRMVRRDSLKAIQALGATPRLELRSTHASRVRSLRQVCSCHIRWTCDRKPFGFRWRALAGIPYALSSQIGCGFACAFCATGKMGLSRNLHAWEMIEQVNIVRSNLERRAASNAFTALCFQGMGEPLANLDQVIQTIRVLCDPCSHAVDGRTITVCTAGLPHGIRRLAGEVPKVRLGISIGSALPKCAKA